uniref:Uncharacterized protein n=1 Tax=Timema monikensis TaxID=170555 RepID=A0A7R9HPA6_9NEOP|nr:unnamed protein product [Timema monikensis]
MATHYRTVKEETHHKQPERHDTTRHDTTRHDTTRPKHLVGEEEFSRSGCGGTQTTTDDIPDFDRNKVSLDIPGELFGSSVNLVTRGSKAVGDVIMNAAQRVQRFIEALKPTVGGKLGVTATRTRRQHMGPNYDASPDLNTVDTTR